MNQAQFKNLKAVAVSAEYGVVVTDKYGAKHAITTGEMTVEMAQEFYRLGLRGPSPELGKALFEKAVERGDAIG